MVKDIFITGAYEKKEIKYGTKVRIISGFHEGCKGKVTHCQEAVNRFGGHKIIYFVKIRHFIFSQTEIFQEWELEVI